MIRYTLVCDNDHSFDSWFQSAEAFDKLRGAGMVACTTCQSTDVTKSLMTPAVRPARKAGEAAARPLTDPGSEAEAALAKLRKHVEANSDYVGSDFATQARAMHEGSAPERAIHGEARLEEARALLEDGVPIAPLPFLPSRKTN
ncbi:DUF1178 family protein [Phaeovulum sp. W22_SRMD_FR3]|uniref:DUF1178 family protein n=1 Tax=Phaeovulum sp. W22_SRMD_FR3 TaxID=3240274 RepID=UPI003F9BA9A9